MLNPKTDLSKDSDQQKELEEFNKNLQTKEGKGASREEALAAESYKRE